MADAQLRRALVIGCADGVWDEVRQALELCTFDSVYCVKLAGVHYRGDGFFTWCGLHPEWGADYRDQRAKLGYHSNFETVAPPDSELGTAGKKMKADRRVSYRYPGMNSSASSGGYAAKVALGDGCDRVVLAGIPMTVDAAHFTRGKAWLQRDAFLVGLHDSIPHWKGRVRSLSGYTREILGAPSPGWLKGATP